MIRLLLPALVALALSAAPADAQIFKRAAACPTCANGACGQPSGPMFAAVPASVPVAMPTACYAPGQCPAGVCGAACPCAAGSCPAACPAMTRPAAGSFTGRRVFFPRVRAFFAGR